MNEDSTVLLTIKLDEGQTEARVKAMTQAIIDGINRVQPVLVVDSLNQVQADQTMVKTHTAY